MQSVAFSSKRALVAVRSLADRHVYAYSTASACLTRSEARDGVPCAYLPTPRTYTVVTVHQYTRRRSAVPALAQGHASPSCRPCCLQLSAHLRLSLLLTSPPVDPCIKTGLRVFFVPDRAEADCWDGWPVGSCAAAPFAPGVSESDGFSLAGPPSFTSRSPRKDHRPRHQELSILSLTLPPRDETNLRQYSIGSLDLGCQSQFISTSPNKLHAKIPMPLPARQERPPD